MRRNRVPACASCAKRLLTIRRLRLAWWVLGSALVVGGLILFPLSRRAQWWEVAGRFALIAGPILGPLAIWQSVSPGPIKIVRRGGKAKQLYEANYITLGFLDAAYAAEFTSLNRRGLWGARK